MLRIVREFVPFRAGVFGSTRTGKTTLIYNLLKNNYINGQISTIYYCYPATFSEHPLDWHDELDFNIEYIDYLPDEEFLKMMDDDSLLVIDDFWSKSKHNWVSSE